MTAKLGELSQKEYVSPWLIAKGKGQVRVCLKEQDQKLVLELQTLEALSALLKKPPLVHKTKELSSSKQFSNQAALLKERIDLLEKSNKAADIFAALEEVYNHFGDDNASSDTPTESPEAASISKEPPSPSLHTSVPFLDVQEAQDAAVNLISHMAEVAENSEDKVSLSDEEKERISNLQAQICALIEELKEEEKSLLAKGHTNFKVHEVAMHIFLNAKQTVSGLENVLQNIGTQRADAEKSFLLERADSILKQLSPFKGDIRREWIKKIDTFKANLPKMANTSMLADNELVLDQMIDNIYALCKRDVQKIVPSVKPLEKTADLDRPNKTLQRVQEKLRSLLIKEREKVWQALSVLPDESDFEALTKHKNDILFALRTDELLFSLVTKKLSLTEQFWERLAGQGPREYNDVRDLTTYDTFILEKMDSLYQDFLTLMPPSIKKLENPDLEEMTHIAKASKNISLMAICSSLSTLLVCQKKLRDAHIEKAKKAFTLYPRTNYNQKVFSYLDALIAKSETDSENISKARFSEIEQKIKNWRITAWENNEQFEHIHNIIKGQQDSIRLLTNALPGALEEPDALPFSGPQVAEGKKLLADFLKALEPVAFPIALHDYASDGYDKTFPVENPRVPQFKAKKFAFRLERIVELEKIKEKKRKEVATTIDKAIADLDTQVRQYHTLRDSYFEPIPLDERPSLEEWENAITARRKELLSLRDKRPALSEHTLRKLAKRIPYFGSFVPTLAYDQQNLVELSRNDLDKHLSMIKAVIKSDPIEIAHIRKFSRGIEVVNAKIALVEDRIKSLHKESQHVNAALIEKQLAALKNQRANTLTNFDGLDAILLYTFDELTEIDQVLKKKYENLSILVQIDAAPAYATSLKKTFINNLLVALQTHSKELNNFKRVLGANIFFEEAVNQIISSSEASVKELSESFVDNVDVSHSLEVEGSELSTDLLKQYQRQVNKVINRNNAKMEFLRKVNGNIKKSLEGISDNISQAESRLLTLDRNDQLIAKDKLAQHIRRTELVVKNFLERATWGNFLVGENNNLAKAIKEAIGQKHSGASIRDYFERFVEFGKTKSKALRALGYPISGVALEYLYSQYNRQNYFRMASKADIAVTFIAACLILPDAFKLLKTGGQTAFNGLSYIKNINWIKEEDPQWEAFFATQQDPKKPTAFENTKKRELLNEVMTFGTQINFLLGKLNTSLHANIITTQGTFLSAIEQLQQPNLTPELEQQLRVRHDKHIEQVVKTCKNKLEKYENLVNDKLLYYLAPETSQEILAELREKATELDNFVKEYNPSRLPALFGEEVPLEQLSPKALAEHDRFLKSFIKEIERKFEYISFPPEAKDLEDLFLEAENKVRELKGNKKYLHARNLQIVIAAAREQLNELKKIDTSKGIKDLKKTLKELHNSLERNIKNVSALGEISVKSLHEQLKRLLHPEQSFLRAVWHSPTEEETHVTESYCSLVKAAMVKEIDSTTSEYPKELAATRTALENFTEYFNYPTEWQEEAFVNIEDEISHPSRLLKYNTLTKYLKDTWFEGFFPRYSLNELSFEDIASMPDDPVKTIESAVKNRIKKLSPVVGYIAAVNAHKKFNEAIKKAEEIVKTHKAKKQFAAAFFLQEQINREKQLLSELKYIEPSYWESLLASVRSTAILTPKQCITSLEGAIKTRTEAVEELCKHENTSLTESLTDQINRIPADRISTFAAEMRLYALEEINETKQGISAAFDTYESNKKKLEKNFHKLPEAWKTLFDADLKARKADFHSQLDTIIETTPDKSMIARHIEKLSTIKTDLEQLHHNLKDLDAQHCLSGLIEAVTLYNSSLDSAKERTRDLKNTFQFTQYKTLDNIIKEREAAIKRTLDAYILPAGYRVGDPINLNARTIQNDLYAQATVLETAITASKTQAEDYKAIVQRLGFPPLPPMPAAPVGAVLPTANYFDEAEELMKIYFPHKAMARPAIMNAVTLANYHQQLQAAYNDASVERLTEIPRTPIYPTTPFGHADYDQKITDYIADVNAYFARTWPNRAVPTAAAPLAPGVHQANYRERMANYIEAVENARKDAKEIYNGALARLKVETLAKINNGLQNLSRYTTKISNIDTQLRALNVPNGVPTEFRTFLNGVLFDGLPAVPPNPGVPGIREQGKIAKAMLNAPEQAPESEFDKIIRLTNTVDECFTLKQTNGNFNVNCKLFYIDLYLERIENQLITFNQKKLIVEETIKINPNLHEQNKIFQAIAKTHTELVTRAIATLSTIGDAEFTCYLIERSTQYLEKVIKFYGTGKTYDTDPLTQFSLASYSFPAERTAAREILSSFIKNATALRFENSTTDITLFEFNSLTRISAEIADELSRALGLPKYHAIKETARKTNEAQAIANGIAPALSAHMGQTAGNMAHAIARALTTIPVGHVGALNLPQPAFVSFVALTTANAANSPAGTAEATLNAAIAAYTAANPTMPPLNPVLLAAAQGITGAAVAGVAALPIPAIPLAETMPRFRIPPIGAAAQITLATACHTAITSLDLLFAGTVLPPVNANKEAFLRDCLNGNDNLQRQFNVIMETLRRTWNETTHNEPIFQITNVVAPVVRY